MDGLESMIWISGRKLAKKRADNEKLEEQIIMRQADLMVVHGHIVTMDSDRRIIQDGALVVIGDTIKAIGETKEIMKEWQATEVLDARNKAIFPGFVNTHDHLFQVLLKGLGRDKKLLDWLDHSVRKAVCAVTPERAKTAAVVGCLESLRSGCTTLMDYQYCQGYPGIDEAVLEAFEETGIRAVLARSQITNNNFPEGFKLYREESEDDYLAAVEHLDDLYKNHPRINIGIAPSCIWEISKEGLIRTHELAKKRDMVLSLHMIETPDDDAFTQKQYGQDVIPFLEEIGFLDSNLVAVHAVNAKPEDIETFKKYDIKISHCPLANMILASGVAPIPEYLEAGLSVSLATDGAASSDVQDMLEVIKVTAMLHKCARKDPSLISAEEVLEMATIGGAKCLKMEDKIGSLEVGKKADFFLFNPRTVKSVAYADPIACLVYSSSEQNIHTTVVGGQILLKNGKFTGVDEEKAIDDCQIAAAEIRAYSGLGNEHWGQKITVGPFQD